ncbi:PH domain-containing protein [Streptomyces sannanensis]|uniref:PH domain-containing protein n=1 Tax=Streptomyces sannanensis TaxID=285536 RepID=A0ABP6SEY5_9ACTN
MTRSSQQSVQPTYADRAFRSGPGLAGGVLVLAIAVWFGVDAIVRGHGATPWLALSALLFVVPLVFAFTLRPAVFVGAERLRVRNPFRTITLPWASVKDVRAAYSSEVFTQEGAKYQLWAIPVSLRQRKGALRRGTTEPGEARLGPSDQAIAEVREMVRVHADNPAAQGEPVIRWAYELIAPMAVGAVLLTILAIIG